MTDAGKWEEGRRKEEESLEWEAGRPKTEVLSAHQLMFLIFREA
jgi:hypothetical protein